jgi:hypothetical protein
VEGLYVRRKRDKFREFKGCMNTIREQLHKREKKKREKRREEKEKGRSKKNTKANAPQYINQLSLVEYIEHKYIVGHFLVLVVIGLLI